MPELKIKNIRTEKKNRKIWNKEIVIYDQKIKLNENRFYLQTKISKETKIRDKKRFPKISWGAIFRVAIFPGARFQGAIDFTYRLKFPKKQKLEIRKDSLKFHGGQFSGWQFSWGHVSKGQFSGGGGGSFRGGGNFPGNNFPGVSFPGVIFPLGIFPGDSFPGTN